MMMVVVMMGVSPRANPEPDERLGMVMMVVMMMVLSHLNIARRVSGRRRFGKPRIVGL